ncbi:MAG: glycoside hydrolase family 20 zincin-like fold domain-containing protein, partial [Clostridium sp.]
MMIKAKNLKSFIAKAMTVIMLFTLLPNVFSQKVQALEGVEVSNKNYEIYPIPQSIEYNNGELNLGAEVNVIFEAGIDDATKNRLFEVLAIKNIAYDESQEITSDKTNFLVGINNSNGIVDNYFAHKNLSDDAHFENIDSHIVSVD